MIQRIHHLGFAVHSLEASIPFYRDVLGLEFLGEEEVTDQGVRVAMFRAGDVRIELLEPLASDGSMAKFLEKRGEGFHHVGFETDDIGAELKRIEERGVELIDKEARPGAHGAKIAFLHPKSTGKVLTEICQNP